MIMSIPWNVPPWHARAACRIADKSADWIAAEPGSAAAAKCKATCRTCPVRITCALTALSQGKCRGVWGGMDEADREALRRLGSQVAA
jgi:WhiB family redox-sensing transcriptional regulator